MKSSAILFATQAAFLPSLFPGDLGLFSRLRRRIFCTSV
jgi:hypothetical protein